MPKDIILWPEAMKILNVTATSKVLLDNFVLYAVRSKQCAAGMTLKTNSIHIKVFFPQCFYEAVEHI